MAPARTRLTPPAAAAASQKWKIIYLQVLTICPGRQRVLSLRRNRQCLRLPSANRNTAIGCFLTAQSFLDEIISELARGNRLEFRDFGVFGPRECVPRIAQNPKTMERIHVPARRTVKFKIGRLMKQKLNCRNKV